MVDMQTAMASRVTDHYRMIECVLTQNWEMTGNIARIGDKMMVKQNHRMATLTSEKSKGRQQWK